MFTTISSAPLGDDPGDPGRGRTVLSVPRKAVLAAAARPRPVRSRQVTVRPDAEPRTLVVPVRASAAGAEAVRLFRDPLGRRVAVTFTSVAQLRNVCGPGQRWVRMAEACLRETLEGLGVAAVVRDPGMVAAPVAGERR
ncbi:SAV_915 family protein [Yinghuangia seranimata]|uniref:SAV_915 family protein n=1 Tax=Yinghuangia seranimata TaxID=408067 RepID=UPI00248C2EEC|nr:SAV_915 family protein [Yinghuangia seranimata]MDI2124551.1 hypothetical protein [Yinghuangia seranimata]